MEMHKVFQPKRNWRAVLGKAKFVAPPFGMGKALDLDGKDDAVVVRRDQSMDVGVGEFTVSAWIRPTELRQGGIVCLGKYSWTRLVL